PVARGGVVGAVEGERVGDAAAVADQEVDERLVALLERRAGWQRGEQARQLVRIDRLGKALLEFRERDAVGKVPIDEAFACDPAQPGPDGYQRAGARRRALHAGRQPALVGAP